MIISNFYSKNKWRVRQRLSPQQSNWSLPLFWSSPSCPWCSSLAPRCDQQHCCRCRRRKLPKIWPLFFWIAPIAKHVDKRFQKCVFFLFLLFLLLQIFFVQKIVIFGHCRYFTFFSTFSRKNIACKEQHFWLDYIPYRLAAVVGSKICLTWLRLTFFLSKGQRL